MKESEIEEKIRHGDYVDWYYISKYQKLSEDFIEMHSSQLSWYYISEYQKLSEDFIEKHSSEVDWYYISKYQKLSEDFIEKHSSQVNWYYISKYQKLSEDFIEKHSDQVDILLQHRKHQEKTVEQKRKEIKEYAKAHNLQFDGTFLYAYRNHDIHGRGMFNKTVFYEPSIYYSDWHCDMDPNEEYSFGFGIWPEGNTPVKIKVEDWGVAVNRGDGKARVLGFEIIP